MLNSLKPVNHTTAGRFLAALWFGVFVSTVAGVLVSAYSSGAIEGAGYTALLLFLLLISAVTYLFLYVDIVVTYRYWLLLAIPTLVLPMLFAVLLAAIPLIHLVRLTVAYFRSQRGLRSKAA